MRSFAIKGLFLGVCLLACPGLPAAEQEWRAAATAVKITPQDNMWLAGYASRDRPADGVTLDLFAKIVVLEDAKHARLAIITLDLIGVPRTLREALEQRLEKKHALPPQSLLLNASHTHSGPELRVRRAEDDISNGGASADPVRVTQALEYSGGLIDSLERGVSDCLSRLEPVQLGYSHARCGFAMNRRLPAEGGPRNSPYPDGPVDHSVPVLRVETPTGELRAILFGYACHNTTLGLYQVNGDYAGYAQQELERAHPGTVAMFVMGCGGDQNPYPRGTVEWCQRHGQALATAVEAALLPKPVPIHGPLQTDLEVVSLEFAAPPERSILEEQAQSTNRFVAGHAKRLLKQLDSTEGVSLEYPYLVQVLRFGDSLTMVALSGEVVIDYALKLKQTYPQERLWIAGYSNDVFGYVPSQRVLEEGGYEGGGAMLYTGFPGPFQPTVEERILDSVDRLLQQTQIGLAP